MDGRRGRRSPAIVLRARGALPGYGARALFVKCAGRVVHVGVFLGLVMQTRRGACSPEAM